MLGKEYRLRKRGSFAYVRSRGKKQSDGYMTFVAVGGHCKRVGFVVSNKVGKAVRRNLVKRRMRGVVREVIANVGCGQMIFVAKPGITELSYGELKSRMLRLLTKSGMLKSV